MFSSLNLQNNAPHWGIQLVGGWWCHANVIILLLTRQYYTSFWTSIWQSKLEWQHYIKLTELEKNRKLNDLLDALDFNQVVIFVKSVSRAAELNKLLVECNFPSICIHSGMSQEERFVDFTCYIIINTLLQSFRVFFFLSCCNLLCFAFG
jgi:hypothetical protein